MSVLILKSLGLKYCKLSISLYPFAYGTHAWIIVNSVVLRKMARVGKGKEKDEKMPFYFNQKLFL